MRQYQTLTPKVFDKIVKDEIELQFKIEYLKDQRLPEVYKRIPEKELKEEAYSIFFKSFSDILESIGIERGKKPRITFWWYDMCKSIDTLDVNRVNFPDIKIPIIGDDEDQYPELEYEIVKKVFPGIVIEDHMVPIWGEARKPPVRYEKSKEGRKDMLLKSKDFNIDFHYRRTKYTMGITGRIKIIKDYILLKNIFDPFLEASKGIRYKTEEERHHPGFYEMDMYSYTKTIATDISRTLSSNEKQIWQPPIKLEVGKYNTMRIGYNWY